jgi:hypothetical protein
LSGKRKNRQSHRQKLAGPQEKKHKPLFLMALKKYKTDGTYIAY